MKIKVAIIVLAVASLALVIALFATKKQAEEQHTTDVSKIFDYSNQVQTASRQIDELGQVNLALTNDLASSRTQLVKSGEDIVKLSNSMLQLSNNLTEISATLVSTKESLATARTQVDSLNTQVTGLNTQVTDLERQNKALDQRAIEMTNILVQLNGLVDATSNQLATAEVNNAFLQSELQKQLAQRAEIEHQFNDLDELRVQVHKIRTEQFVAKRVELDKYDRGNSGKKGAELLQRPPPKSVPTPPTRPGAYDLNVEVGSDGSVRVIPPLGQTNVPAAH